MALPPGSSGLPVLTHSEPPFTLEEDVHLLHCAASLGAAVSFATNIEQISSLFSKRFVHSNRTHRQLQSRLHNLVYSHDLKPFVHTLALQDSLSPDPRAQWMNVRRALHVRSSLIYFLRLTQNSEMDHSSPRPPQHSADKLPPQDVIVLNSESGSSSDYSAHTDNPRQFGSLGSKSRTPSRIANRRKRTKVSADGQLSLSDLSTGLPSYKRRSGMPRRGHNRHGRGPKASASLVKVDGDEVVVISDNDHVEPPTKRLSSRGRSSSRRGRGQTSARGRLLRRSSPSFTSPPEMPKRTASDMSTAERSETVDVTLRNVEPFCTENDVIRPILSKPSSQIPIRRSLAVPDPNVMEPCKGMQASSRMPTPLSTSTAEHNRSSKADNVSYEHTLGENTNGSCDGLNSNVIDWSNFSSSKTDDHINNFVDNLLNSTEDATHTQLPPLCSLQSPPSPHATPLLSLHSVTQAVPPLPPAGASPAVPGPASKQRPPRGTILHPMFMPKSMALSDDRTDGSRLQSLLDDLDAVNALSDDSQDNDKAKP